MKLGGIGTRSLLGVAMMLVIAQPGVADISRNCLFEGFLPRNRVQIPPDSFFANGITQAKFNAVLDKIATRYAPVVAKRGGVLTVERDWASAIVNAYAERSGNKWIIRMFGGMARHPALTEDGFTLVACHEIGHHLGGAPKYRGFWAANEGQSDYFSTLKCLRSVFAGQDNGAIVGRMNVPPAVITACQQSFPESVDQAICQRNSMAAASVAALSHAISGEDGPAPDFSRTDPDQVDETYDNHPAPQCRLDTYVSGARCPVYLGEELSETDPSVGTCSEERGVPVGARPRCWYRPGSETPIPPPQIEIAPVPLIAGQITYVSGNPGAVIPIEYDVGGFSEAGGAYIEVSRPNADFLVPNGTIPDPYRLRWGTFRAVVGQLLILPYRDLPGWGVYSLRVIPLDVRGKQAVGRFSDASRLVLRPQTISAAALWPSGAVRVPTQDWFRLESSWHALPPKAESPR